jgi:lipid II:glycine glycyltransferase (peptidoglycan interpeptide bridge formation enzyme)
MGLLNRNLLSQTLGIKSEAMNIILFYSLFKNTARKSDYTTTARNERNNKLETYKGKARLKVVSCNEPEVSLTVWLKDTK